VFTVTAEIARIEDLLDAIQQAIKRDQYACRQQAQMENLCRRFESLTPRAPQVIRVFDFL
jgi:FixJ family two-component response regulator